MCRLSPARSRATQFGPKRYQFNCPIAFRTMILLRLGIAGISYKLLQGVLPLCSLPFNRFRACVCSPSVRDWAICGHQEAGRRKLVAETLVGVPFKMVQERNGFIHPSILKCHMRTRQRLSRQAVLYRARATCGR